MYMRIVWGKIRPGAWSEFEAAFVAAMAARGNVAGLRNHWLARDQHDTNAGYSVTLWDTEPDMQRFWDSEKRKAIMAPLEPYYVNQFTITHCEVKYSLQA